MSTTKAFYWVFIFGLFGLFSCQQPTVESQPEEPEIVEEVLEVEVAPEFTCESLPSSYGSYEDAKNQISSATFPVQESANTAGSSWMRSANFYSCDGQQGFLIIGTDNQTYIHANVSVGLWEEFANASSKGSFYSRNIKGRYSFNL
jgi:hypothetical protein